MAVNNSILAFYYIFDVLCLVQVRSPLLIKVATSNIYLEYRQDVSYHQHWSNIRQISIFKCFLCLSSSLLQGLSVMLVFTVFNSEVMEAWRLACLGKKSPGEDPPRPPQNAVSNTHTQLPGSLLELKCFYTTYTMRSFTHLCIKTQTMQLKQNKSSE